MRETRQDLDYSTRDYEGFKQLMLTKLKEKLPEYSDFSDNDLGVILIDLLALGQDILSYYIDKTANESLLSTALERQNVVELCANLGYTLKNATPSIFEQVFEIEPTEEETYIPKGFKINTIDNGYDEVITFETVEELIIPPHCTGLEKDLQDKYLYSVEVVQGRTIEEELLGTSTGLPNQEFKLWESPVIASQVEILVNEGSGYENWEYVPSFLNSKSTDKHFSIKVDGSSKATIVFGNGTLGAIPSVYNDGILAKYRVGGGTTGNVAPNIITQMENPRADIKSTFNPSTAKVPGEDVESIENAKSNAIRNLRTLDRAVTLQDYKDLAPSYLDFVLLSDAEEGDDGRTVNIYLISRFNEVLTEEEKQEALELYNEKKLLGVIPVIKDANKVPINLKITVERNAKDTTDYETLVPNIVEEYFKIGNFNFQTKFSQSALLRELILILPGVQDVTINTTSVIPPLNPGDVISKGTIEVEVV